MKEQIDFSNARRGPVTPLEPNKTILTLPIDNEVLAWFREEVNRAGGGDYLKLMNNALHEHIRQRTEPLEAILRRVVREEMHRAA